MSTERAFVVGLPADPSFLSLADDVRSAARRAGKADPGDRLDIARLEALATRLEQAALNRLNAPRTAVAMPDGGQTGLVGADQETWPRSLPEDIRAAAIRFVAQGLLPVLVIDPHARGVTKPAEIGSADDPAAVWEAEEGVVGGRAVEARFRAQIAEALSYGTARRVPISPSGINNAVVTEILREFVVAEPGATRVDAPVEYRDGSRSAHPFPLRSLPLRTELPPASLELRFALLSIRHTEMDATVHGAWLRNADISRPRPAAQTDDLVHDISLQQLGELCRAERHVRLYIYQTGLETAVVGFYRALAAHLARHPGTVSVQPMYFVPPPRPKKGRAQRQHRARHGSHAEPQTLLTSSSTFRKGTVWTT